MANLINISSDSLINQPNINLLPQFAMFDEAFTWNVVSGSATASNINQSQLFGERCLRIVPSIASVVNSGGTQMQTTVTEDGNYLFSLRHKSNCPTTNTQQVKIKIYVNGLLTDYAFFADTLFNDVYRTYYQIIPLLTGDVVDIAFQFLTPAYGGIFKHYFDGLKLEFDNFGLGTPTVFSAPLQRILQTSQTIDAPSISSNSYHIVEVTLTGASVGDYVQVTYPAELITLGLIVGVPIVTATDTIKMILHNHSGGSVNPASGTYTFKIVK
jgi:hypothetical protein